MARMRHMPRIGELADKTCIDDVFNNLVFWLKLHNKRKAAKLQKQWDALRKEEEKSDFLDTTVTEAFAPYVSPYTFFGKRDCTRIWGIWPDWDQLNNDIDDGEVLKVNDTGEVPAKHRGYVVYVNDHGNVTLFFKGLRHKLREVWAVV